MSRKAVIGELTRWIELSGGEWKAETVTDKAITFKSVTPEDLLYRAGEVWKRLGQRWELSTPFVFWLS